MSDQRFAARRHDVRFRRLRRIATAVLAVVVLGLLVWVIWFSKVLAVRSIEVTGETTLKSAQIRSEAKIRTGEPLARLDTSGVQSRVASMERVQTVSISRSWPHTVRIEVVERTPVAWVTLDGEIRALDRFGVDFRTYSTAPKGLLEVKVNVGVARQRQQTLVAVSAVVDVIERDDAALRKQISSVSASSKDSITLELTKGRTVTWGSSAASIRKIDVLRALLSISARDYDVSAPDQPTTRK